MSTHNDISAKYCPRFGQTAVSLGFIDGEQLKQALWLQVEDDLTGRNHRLLGTILFEQGWMDSEQIESVMTVVMREIRQEEDGEA